jgi:hypothetical protein
MNYPFLSAILFGTSMILIQKSLDHFELNLVIIKIYEYIKNIISGGCL